VIIGVALRTCSGVGFFVSVPGFLGIRKVKLGFAAGGVGAVIAFEALDLARDVGRTTSSSKSTSISSSSSSLSIMAGLFLEPRESVSLLLLLLLLLRLALLLGRFSTSGD